MRVIHTGVLVWWLRLYEQEKLVYLYAGSLGDIELL